MRILFLIIGIILVLGGGACAIPSLVTYRALDDDGFISGGGRMTTPSAAFVTRTAQFREVTEKEVEEGRTGGDVKLRIRAERTDGGEVLVGIGDAEAIRALVVRGSNELINDFEFDPFKYDSVVTGGARPIGRPEEGLFVAVASGPGEQEITWIIEPGDWRAVIMNADGSANVDVEAEFGARFPYLRGFAIAGMIIGGAVLLLGVFLIAFQFRPGRNKSKPDPEAGPADAPA